MGLAILISLNHLTGFFTKQLKQTLSLPHFAFTENSSRWKFAIILEYDIFSIY